MTSPWDFSTHRSVTYEPPTLSLTTTYASPSYTRRTKNFSKLRADTCAQITQPHNGDGKACPSLAHCCYCMSAATRTKNIICLPRTGLCMLLTAITCPSKRHPKTGTAYHQKCQRKGGGIWGAGARQAHQGLKTCSCPKCGTTTDHPENVFVGTQNLKNANSFQLLPLRKGKRQYASGELPAFMYGLGAALIDFLPTSDACVWYPRPCD